MFPCFLVHVLHSSWVFACLVLERTGVPSYSLPPQNSQHQKVGGWVASASCRQSPAASLSLLSTRRLVSSLLGSGLQGADWLRGAWASFWLVSVPLVYILCALVETFCQWPCWLTSTVLRKTWLECLLVPVPSPPSCCVTVGMRKFSLNEVVVLWVIL